MALGYGVRSELIFHRFSGAVEDHERYTVVTTPDNPDYYFGNYLLLKNPADLNDLNQLEHDFKHLVGEPPRIKHKKFRWSLDLDDTCNVSGFIDKGYQFNVYDVLVADKASFQISLDRPVDTPPVKQSSIHIRQFETDNDWRQWYDLELMQRAKTEPLDAFENYVKGTMHTYRGLILAGKGGWYGAFDGKELVASAGIFIDNDFACFQRILTKPSCRRQGIGSALISSIVQSALERRPKVILSTCTGFEIYKSLGFSIRERQLVLYSWPRCS